MRKVLFVCTGNTCRSPMAAAVANHMFKNRAMPFAAASCGVFAHVGAAASAHALAVMAGHGLDISGHAAGVVDEDEVAAACVIITMTQSHKNRLLSLFPHFADKVHTMDIDDPFGGPLALYEDCAAQIKKYIEAFGWEDFV